MKTIAIISTKGGSGKTTLALNLATTATEAHHRCVVLDLDPQASAKGWRDDRDANHEYPIVISAHASRLAEVLGTAQEHGAQLCLIDTAPHSETAALAAARAADLILIPCRPAILDLRGIATSVDLVNICKRPALIVLNAMPPPRGTKPSSTVSQAEEALRGYGLPVATCRISQRAVFSHSLTAGLSAVEFDRDGRAAAEIRALYKLACDHVNMPTHTKKEKIPTA